MSAVLMIRAEMANQVETIGVENSNAVVVHIGNEQPLPIGRQLHIVRISQIDRAR